MRDELIDYIDAITPETLDMQRLDAILNELTELDPIPPGTYKSVEESLQEFKETYAHLFHTTDDSGTE